jgi:hypothetical protein
VDFLGNVRSIGAGADMGAFEFGGAIPRLSASEVSVPATLFPNPSLGGFELRFAEPVNGTLEVFGLQGARVLSLGLFEAQRAAFDLGNQPAGVYLVRVVSGGQVQTFQAVVQKP